MLFQFLCLLNNNCQYPSIIRAIDQRFSAGTIPPPHPVDVGQYLETFLVSQVGHEIAPSIAWVRARGCC